MRVRGHLLKMVTADGTSSVSRPTKRGVAVDVNVIVSKNLVKH